MIVHFWDLPENRNYIILKEKFKNKLIKILKNKKYPFKLKNKIKIGKIRIKKLIEVSKKEKIILNIIEKNIIWVGGNNSKGLSNPKLPFNFKARKGARFIAAIINDGTLTKEGSSYGRLMYDNFDKSLRESVIKDYLIIFGGKKDEIAFRNTEKKKYLEFSSVIRDIIEIVIKNKGPKTESNIKLPDFVLKDKECMLGWIEQTIADEGEVKFYPNKYRRAIVWRRSLDITNILREKTTKDSPLRRLPLKIQELVQSQKLNLIESEKKILDSMSIKYKLYNLGLYITTKNKIRTRWQINIAGRENLLKLRKLIKIPSLEKDSKFHKIILGYTRYKEPLKIKENIINLGKNKKNFTSLDLKKIMNYKETNTAIKWLKKFEHEGFIKKIKESSYGEGVYRKPAEYKII